MATFKFTKVYEEVFCAYVEAADFEEAKSLVDQAEWEQDDERYLSRSYAQEIDEEGDCGNDMDWVAYR